MQWNDKQNGWRAKNLLAHTCHEQNGTKIAWRANKMANKLVLRSMSYFVTQISMIEIDETVFEMFIL